MPAITYRGSHTLDCTVLDVRKQWRTLGAVNRVWTVASCVGGGAPALPQARPGLVRGRDGGRRLEEFEQVGIRGEHHRGVLG